MADIPHDVLEQARRTYGVIESFGWNVSWYSANPIPDDAWPIDIIARAILAERERCALIAQKWQPQEPPMYEVRSPWRTWEVSDAIAADIRRDAA